MVLLHICWQGPNPLFGEHSLISAMIKQVMHVSTGTLVLVSSMHCYITMFVKFAKI